MINENEIAKGIEFLTEETVEADTDRPEWHLLADAARTEAEKRRKFLASLEQSICCRGDDEESCKCQ